MKIEILNQSITLTEPEHMKKGFMQETKYALKNLPNAFINTGYFMGFGAAVSTFIPQDTTSKIILGTFSAAVLLCSATLNNLKSHYNTPQSNELFETEFRAYIENFVKRRFKQLTKLEKAKKHANEQKIKDVEHQQIYLIQDTANVLLNYVDEHNEVVEKIRNLYDKTIFENQYQADDKFVADLKAKTAYARTPVDGDKYYVLKILYENLQVFAFCDIETKKKIISHMFDYEQHLASDAVVEEYMQNHNTAYIKPSELKTLHKIDMEEEDRDKDIFNEFDAPFDYDYFLRDDISTVIDNVNKFGKEVELEEHVNDVISQMIQGVESSNNQPEDTCGFIQ